MDSTERTSPLNYQFVPRPDTCDQNVFNNIIHYNEYGLPDRFEPTDSILDIGGHVGSFTRACIERGAGKVVIIEPDEGNFLRLMDHLQLDHNSSDSLMMESSTGRIEAHRVAVWRSDLDYSEPVLLPHTGPIYDTSACEFNTGGGNVLALDSNGDRVQVPALPLDFFLEKLDQVRLLKIDCEGSEWPIFYSLTDPVSQLSSVHEIVGEFHELSDDDSARVMETMPGPTLAHADLPWNTKGLSHFFRTRTDFSRIEINAPDGDGLGLFRISRED